MSAAEQLLPAPSIGTEPAELIEMEQAYRRHPTFSGLGRAQGGVGQRELVEQKAVHRGVVCQEGKASSTISSSR